MDRVARFALFIDALRRMSACADAEGARRALSAALDRIEDRHAGVPSNPARWRDDGRMYPPQDDSEVTSPGAGIRRFRTRGHHVEFAPNGALRIVSLSGQVVIDKAGADGRRIGGVESP